MLNCDQTFDCLTDPIHRHSEDVERHLESCPRCRDMADILEPALDLFDESLDNGIWDLPLSSGEYGLEQQPLADRAPTGAASRPWSSQLPRRRRVRDEGLTVAVFLVLVASLAAALVNVGNHDESAAAVAITLPANCQRTEATESAADNVIAGCVACHLKMESLADMEPMQREHAQSLVQKCATCHLDMTVRPGEQIVLADAGDSSQGLLSVCLFGHAGG